MYRVIRWVVANRWYETVMMMRNAALMQLELGIIWLPLAVRHTAKGELITVGVLKYSLILMVGRLMQFCIHLMLIPMSTAEVCLVLAIQRLHWVVKDITTQADGAWCFPMTVVPGLRKLYWSQAIRRLTPTVVTRGLWLVLAPLGLLWDAHTMTLAVPTLAVGVGTPTAITMIPGMRLCLASMEPHGLRRRNLLMGQVQVMIILGTWLKLCIQTSLLSE
mmetsp:Transcript_10142/g.13214  ORF Transcript_10142/g.13214 Transcript_10142/m.13214 type:complete len:219 (-) Transcript_10142:6419-7075(-)